MRTAALLALAATLAGTACTPAPPTQLVPAEASAVAYDYADELSEAQAAIAAARSALVQGPVVWPQWQTLAEAQLAYAKLTGDYPSYSAAAASLAQAFALAGNGGPYLSRARYHFVVHQLDQVDADLRRAERENDADRAAITGLRADLAFYRGDYPQALAGYRAALDQREDLTGLVRLALCHASLGHDSEAAALLDRAADIYHGDSPYPPAWLALQQGLLALHRGRWELARGHYEHALRLLPGWWLAREHSAEVQALQGNTETALRLYAEIIHDTGQPEYMDAMAKLLRERGDEAAAEPWIAAASKLYTLRLARWPEASYGHALDHFLLFGTPEQSLALARKNHALRPNGESQIKLSRALLRTGDHAEAVRVIRRALASDWNTAELHAVAAQVFAAAGLAQEAQTQAEIAKAINPHAAQQYAPTTVAPAATD